MDHTIFSCKGKLKWRKNLLSFEFACSFLVCNSSFSSLFSAASAFLSLCRKEKGPKIWLNCISFYFRIYQFTTVDKTKHVGRTLSYINETRKEKETKITLVPYDEIKIYLQLSHLSNQGYSFIFNFLGSLFKLSNVLVFSFC